MATKLKVAYADGREVDVVASPRAQVETERHFKGTNETHANLTEASYYLAWASLHHAGKEPADFEAWLDRIADVNEIPPTVEDEQNSDPTPATQTPTGSSD